MVEPESEWPKQDPEPETNGPFEEGKEDRSPASWFEVARLISQLIALAIQRTQAPTYVVLINDEADTQFRLAEELEKLKDWMCAIVAQGIVDGLLRTVDYPALNPAVEGLRNTLQAILDNSKVAVALRAYDPVLFNRVVAAVESTP